MLKEFRRATSECFTVKLESISIRQFRMIEALDLAFTDDLGLIRDCIPIVGPNTSGKTTILDAVALNLMPATELYQFRDGLRLSPPALVRSGSVTKRSKRPRKLWN